MELKLERLLRFSPNYAMMSLKASPNIDSFELAVAMSFHGHFIENDGIFVSPHELLMNIISGSVPTSKLPPRCWFYLVRRAAWNAFKPLDLDKDDHTNMFPLNLCSAILHSFHTSPKGLTQDFNSPLVLDFKDALPYFLDKIYDDVLGMFSAFIKHPSLSEPSLPQFLKVIVAAIKFLLHRLSLSKSNMSHTTIQLSLDIAIMWIRGQTFSSQEATALITVLEDIIALCVVPPLNTESDWSNLCHYTIRTYQSLTAIAPSACSLSGLQSMVDFMISHWDQMGDFSPYKSDAVCRVMTDLLVKHIPVAFTAFYESQCLQSLGSHTFHEASVPMVSAYVTGVLTMQHGSDGAVDVATLQLHIDRLHHPQNLFIVCSILATHGIEDVDRRAQVYRDIVALVQLRPRDAAWEECRRKLHDLVEGDGGNFFNKQLIWEPYHRERRRSLRTEEIQVEKENIRYAIHVLDGFFDGGTHTMVPTSHAWLPTGRIGHFLKRCLGRKLEDKPEQEQQV
ncbi:hypothetical protein F5146DRAFT_161971 [Armillaria mellea]|nr:hypothetical protein F5146DRAFT_161971 [Armillaria mellea]